VVKKLAKNIGFLTLSQGANYILPLITIPYITRVVGPNNYGLIEFGTVAMLYFSAVVIYGFNTTATRKISSRPDDMKHVSNVFSTVVSTRIVLFIGTTVLFTAALFAVPAFQQQTKMMLFAYPIVLGWALYPDFLFQGVQKLQFVALSNFLIKALAAVLIFVLIKNPGDFYLVLAINAAAQIAVGIGLLVFSFRLVPGLKFAFVKWAGMLRQLKESSYVFFSLFFTRIYVFGSILFLGLMLSDYELGIFAAGLKLVTVAQSFLFLPLFGALFPYLSNLFANDFQGYQQQFKKILGLMLAISLLSVVVLVGVPELFINLVFGADYLDTVPFLQIMAPVLLATTFSHFAMQQGLIIYHEDRKYLIIVVAVGLLSLPLNYVGIKLFGLYGAAWAKLLVEVSLAIIAWIVFYRMWKSKSVIAK
jgi:PST family polysaccharide transporter